MIVRPETPPPVPEGFIPLEPPGTFLNRAAYWYQKPSADGGGTIVGTWVTEDQCNSEGVAHGGFLLTFADFALTFILMGITLNLSCDFLRPAFRGSWIEVDIRARRRSGALIFADAIATCEGKDILRMSGLFRPFEKRS